MRRMRMLFLLAMASMTLVSNGYCQTTVRWEATLENAQRSAGQTNRLVLIYFWAPWCEQCKRMEAEVYSQPAVAAGVAADYVPVKVNTDHFPATASQYGISAVPATVIIAPQGQVIDIIRGRPETAQYMTRLSRVAADARRRGNTVVAQLPGGNTTADAAPAGDTASAGLPAIGQPASAKTRATPVAAISVQPQQPSATAVSPSTTAGLSDNRYAQYFNQNQPVSSSQSRYTQSESAAVVSVAPGTAAIGSTDVAPPTGASPAVQPPSPNPPIGLDGHCPVTLGEKQQWVPGDRRWGVIHRERTYLFIGPEEQRRFFTDPDRYAPAMSGNDLILAMEQGQTVPGMREHGVFFGGQVYLFASEASLERFSKTPHLYAAYAAEAMRVGGNPGR